MLSRLEKRPVREILDSVVEDEDEKVEILTHIRGKEDEYDKKSEELIRRICSDMSEDHCIGWIYDIVYGCINEMECEEP